ncbi:MAG: formyltransferase family protein, partial [Myxococcota bacterium]
MRFLYVGVPLGAVVLARAGLTPAACCLAPLDLPGRRRVRRASAAWAPSQGREGALVLGAPDLEDPGVQAALASVRPEAILSFFWPRRLPEAVLAMAPAWGVHPSLLPAWRGPDPTYWALRSGSATTGVSLHRLERAYDTGPVAARSSLAIRATDDSWTLVLHHRRDREARRDPSARPEQHAERRPVEAL